MSKLEGGCLCGKVRYVAGSSLATAICHCTHCQKASGSAFSLNMLVPDADFALTGVTKSYEDRGDSGKPLYRHFCPNCGSSLFSQAESLPGVKILKLGTLDDPSSVKPGVQLYCDSRQSWVPPMPELQSFTRGRH